MKFFDEENDNLLDRILNRHLGNIAIGIIILGVIGIGLIIKYFWNWF